MNWTKCKPMYPGYYWHKYEDDNIKSIVHVKRDDKNLLFATLYVDSYDVSTYADGLWSDTPIEKPTDVFSFGETVYVPFEETETWEEGRYVEFKEGYHCVLLKLTKEIHRFDKCKRKEDL